MLCWYISCGTHTEARSRGHSLSAEPDESIKTKCCLALSSSHILIKINGNYGKVRRLKFHVEHSEIFFFF